MVVSIVVDQFAAWLAHERLPELPSDGGFARLLREGTRVRDMRYMHAATDTAPGHSALYTGRAPRESGIFTNELPVSKKNGSVLADASTKTISADGVQDRASASLARLLVPTVADELREKSPDALILSISLKDRGALFGGGRKPSASLWFDSTLGSFVTSTAMATEFPRWAKELGNRSAIEARSKEGWALLDEPWVRAHAKTPDNQPGEGDLGKLGITFPHSISTPGAFRASPHGDAAIVALATAALRAEYRSTRPTLLALSFSSFDAISHTFGPDSWESWDELRRLDALLASLFKELDQLVPQGYGVLLSADHGAMHMPEAAALPGTRAYCQKGASKDLWDRPCAPIARLLPSMLETSLEASIEKALGRKGPFIEGMADPFVFYTDNMRALGSADRRKADKAVQGVFASYKGRVLRTEERAAGLARCAQEPAEWDESLPALSCRALPQNGSSGDLYVMVESGTFFDPGYVEGKGASHGSPYLYDRSVPLFVRSKDKSGAGKQITAPTRYNAFSEVLRSMFGLDGRSIDQVLTARAKP
jgi:hypothetical protein